MSELKRVIEQCDACGRFRYPNDLIAYDCHGCGEWAEKQIIALRAEVAALEQINKDRLCITCVPLLKENNALRAECAEAWRVHSEVVAELKAKLAKYTEPLTPMQADDISREFNGHGKLVMDMDAAIRAAREGAR